MKNCEGERRIDEMNLARQARSEICIKVYGREVRVKETGQQLSSQKDLRQYGQRVTYKNWILILLYIFSKIKIINTKMATRSRQYDHFLKYVIVGDSSVGKSCLLLRFADDQFNQNYMTTIGVDFRFKTVKSNNKTVKLQIWDTAGQQRFRTITNTYYKSAHAVILVYDITNKESFESIQNFWLDQVENYAQPDTLKILVGNKADMRETQAVSTQAAAQFAKSKGMLFFQTSARTAEHVNQSFMGITSQLVKKLSQGQAIKKPEGQQRMALGTQQQKGKKTGCCY